MPACCIINCISRTDNAHKIKLFRFPKDKSIRQQWIKACRRNEKEIKINSARICSLHFANECFEMKWTMPRSTNVSATEICRLKKNSVPTMQLHVEK
ncbi:THAP domain-containing protein 10 [Trachymyrmex cornetzi]|uniref:THAP domain-containing protein 10 n=1 Tax=Trachymyrmex cornetzi TaxID=471704 RepID=A0A151J389_9HYME|nr:THAP domain-containing protein 10 [Trachymyrmex cornetzi]